MAKIKLIIADPDEGYVLGLSDYISGFYSHKFEVYTFTVYECLFDFLISKNYSFDILLVGNEFYTDNIKLKQSGISVLLGPVGLTQNIEGQRVINRYQHVDKLIGDIAEMLLGNSLPQISIHGGNKNTKIIGMCASGGGVGKTSLSLGCSIQALHRGFKAFYLNLETINSVYFMDYDKKKSLSKILFYLKEKNIALPLKIESTRCIDTNYGIHYFSPIESPLDFDEVSLEEVGVLINTLRAMGEYDFVFIDLPDSFAGYSTGVLANCDHVVILTEQNLTSRYRHNIMIDHMRNMSHVFGNNIMEKSISVLNKYDKLLSSGVSALQMDTDNYLKIPFIPEGRSGGIEACLQSKAFIEGVNSIIEYLI